MRRIGIPSMAVVLAFALFVEAIPAQSNAHRLATGRIQTYRSKSFLLNTDLPTTEAKELLERLETMLRLISAYWGQPNKQVIEMYVAHDIDSWPAEVLGKLDPYGVRQMRSGAGVTSGLTQSVGPRRFTKSTVYATADRGTPQHEAVHAYCQQTFGRTGPLWYSEGMAEMGQYWRENDAAVHCDQIVMRYLKQTQPKSLNDIVNPTLEITGDSWQNYAWRWALCHLLANNPNYAPRFRPLGLGLLTQQDVSFESVYGPMANEIIFEYLFFLDHMETGYRVDLCSWDWQAKATSPTRTKLIRSEIAAAGGWQPARVLVKSGETYEYSAEGRWQTEKEGVKLTADGAEDGNGRLVGILFNDYKLSEPFELGEYGTFTAPGDGQLFVRCRDAWGQLGDNRGDIELKIKQHDATRPLPRPDHALADVRTRSAESPDEEDTPAASPSRDQDIRKAESKLRLGKLLLNRKPDKAQEYFEEVLKLAPGSDAASEAKRLLENL